MSLPDFGDLLGASWFGNAGLRGDLVYLRRGAGTRDRGLVRPGTWVELELPEDYVVHESSSPAGDRPLQVAVDGDRVEDGLAMLIPGTFVARTSDPQTQADADVVQWRGSSYRVTAAYVDRDEVGWTSLTAARIQAKNLPSDLPPPPPVP